MKLDLSKIVPKEILTKSGNKIYSLNLSYAGETILISTAKDKHKDIWYPKWIKVPENQICLWYSWSAGRNQSQNINSGRRYKYLLLPQFLPLDKLTFNALGLLEAEMTKGNLRKSSISFTNSEPEIINTVLRFFRRFRLEEENWSWSIVFNFKLKELENQQETQNRERAAKNYWLKFSDISYYSKRNKFISYTGNKNYKMLRITSASEFGSLRIDYSNIILFQVVMKLLGEIKDILPLDKIDYYLQGIFAGEASVKPSKFKSLSDVSVGAQEMNDKIFFANCLLILGINSSFEKNCLRIHSLDNFLKIHQYNLLELHPIRHKKFLNCLSNFTQIPKRLKVKYSSFKEEVNNIDDQNCEMV